MGRSPFFTLSDVPTHSATTTSEIIKSLKKGQKIRMNLTNFQSDKSGCNIHRSISTYSYEPSALRSGKTYVVQEIDYIPVFNQINLRVIALIDSHHPHPENHMYGWYVTTDGYIRECEHFGIMKVVESIEIL